MKALLVAALAASAFATAPVRARDSESIVRAQEVAKSWLALIDAGKYSRSWEQAAGLFKGALTKPQWEQAAKMARSPLGDVQRRKVKSARFTRSLPWAPEGEYIVIQYESKFEQRLSAIETVTPLREKDGSWKVSGYFIK